jgi:hypothetical protein
MTSFAFEPIYGSMLLAFAIAAGTIGVILWVTPPTENRMHRRWLILLRAVAAIVLLLAVFRPALFRTDNRPAEAALVVAADVSRSMTLPDGDGNTRWDTQRRVWQRLASSMDEMDASLGLRLLVYDGEARTIASASADSLDKESPSGDLTDLSAAALAAIQSVSGQPIAGVVLIGDGTQTASLEGSGAQRVVETLDALGVPLWTVPIGPAAGASAAREVMIDALPQELQLFAGNQVSIEFQVITRGLSGIEVPIRLSWIDIDGNTREVASRAVVPRASSDIASVSVPVLAPAPGVYRLKVEADPQAGELVTSNNAQIAFVDVSEGGGRILYLEGAARLEQTFLRRALRRFPDLDLTYRWIPSDTASTWPIDLGDDFESGKYDIYILGDLNAAAFGDEQLRELAATISAGAGLMTLGGFEAYGSGGYAASPLADVLPVLLEGNTTGAAPRQIPSPLNLRLAKVHPITELGGDDPTTAWQQLPPLLGANRWNGVKVAPGVSVLLESAEGAPLLVVGEYGGGRVASLAFDSTWRWWRAGKSEIHRRFWRQLILWLLSREQTSDDKILVQMDSRRFAKDSPPDFRAEVDLISDPDQSLDLIAEVIDEGGTVIPITTSTDSLGAGSNETAIRGSLPELEPGIYRLRVSPQQLTESLGSEEVAFQVIDDSRELAQPMADPVYLRQLAALTSRYGGAAFTADEVDSLIETIKQRRRQAETPIVEKFRLGDDPITGWILFGCFATAISAEWFLRRRWGLA